MLIITLNVLNLALCWGFLYEIVSGFQAGIYGPGILGLSCLFVLLNLSWMMTFGRGHTDAE